MFCCCFSSKASRDRRLSKAQTSSLATANANLAKIFEELKCPVCFNVCVPPIHNCVNGHIICNTCREKGSVTSCPTCREALNGARNYFAENFVINYAQQCRYASQGCEHLRLKGSSMKPHEDKCMFRPIKCVVPSCSHELPYKNFLSHLDYAHKVSGTDKLPANIQLTYNPKQKYGRKTRWLPYYIQAFDNVFYVMMQRVRRSFWIWTYFQTFKESEDLEYNYYAYIKLKHPDQKISQSWQGPAYPVRTPFKSIMSEGCCFTLSELTVKNFASQGLLNFIVDIRKSPRRTLKGVKFPGDDSDTGVASASLPVEYTRQPSFYEPNSPQPSDATNDLVESINRNIPGLSPAYKIQLAKHLSLPRPPIIRTPAIGIFGNNGNVHTISTPCVHVNQRIQGRNGEEASSINNGNADEPEKDFVDKVASQSMFRSKSSMRLR